MSSYTWSGLVGAGGGSSAGGGVTSLLSSQIQSKTSAYTIVAADVLILCNTSGASFTLTLPNPNTYKQIVIKDIGGAFSSNPLTLAQYGSEQIEGVATSRLFYTNFGSWVVQSDGTNWWLL